MTNTSPATVIDDKHLPMSKRTCPQCSLLGHVTTRSKACLKNPAYLELLEKQLINKDHEGDEDMEVHNENNLPPGSSSQ